MTLFAFSNYHHSIFMFFPKPKSGGYSLSRRKRGDERALASASSTYPVNRVPTHYPDGIFEQGYDNTMQRFLLHWHQKKYFCFHAFFFLIYFYFFQFHFLYRIFISIVVIFSIIFLIIDF